MALGSSQISEYQISQRCSDPQLLGFCMHNGRDGSHFGEPQVTATLLPEGKLYEFLMFFYSGEIVPVIPFEVAISIKTRLTTPGLSAAV